MFRMTFVETAPGLLVDLRNADDGAPAPTKVQAGGRRFVDFDWDLLAPWSARRRSLSAILWRLALLLPAAALTAALWWGAASVSSTHRGDVAPIAVAAQAAYAVQSN